MRVAPCAWILNCEFYKRTGCWPSNGWESTTLKGIEQDSFYEDGMINAEQYTGILFLFKEPNVLEYRDGGAPAQRSHLAFYQREGDNRPKHIEKVGRIYLALQGNWLPSKEDAKKALQKVASMNINKRGGDNKISDEYVMYIERYRDFILREIELLAPKTILCMGTLEDFSAIGGQTLAEKLGCRVMDVWHTAYGMQYCRHEWPELAEVARDKNIAKYMFEFRQRLGEQ